MMDNLICTECATTYYSAAARVMVERAERCDCGALLRLVDDDDRQGVNLTVITSPSFIS
jgi:hypothetical protein